MATSTAPFPSVETNCNLKQPIFEENRASWQKALGRFEEALAQVSAEGDESSCQRHVDRAQLLGMSTVILDPIT